MPDSENPFAAPEAYEKNTLLTKLARIPTGLTVFFGFSGLLVPAAAFDSGETSYGRDFDNLMVIIYCIMYGLPCALAAVFVGVKNLSKGGMLNGLGLALGLFSILGGIAGLIWQLI